MRTQRRRRPTLEPLESKALLSGVPGSLPMSTPVVNVYANLVANSNASELLNI